jgi:hypothetical protein
MGNTHKKAAPAAFFALDFVRDANTMMRGNALSSGRGVRAKASINAHAYQQVT